MFTAYTRQFFTRTKKTLVMTCEACQRDNAEMVRIINDDIDFVMKLCKRCLKYYLNEVVSTSDLQYIHNSYISGKQIKFIK